MITKNGMNIHLLAENFFSTEIMPKIQEYIKTYKLDEIISFFQWNLLHVIMEDVYREAADRPVFFLELLKIYESGHFPCGWILKWLEGRLIVY